jgi:hypothetical protein
MSELSCLGCSRCAANGADMSASIQIPPPITGHEVMARSTRWCQRCAGPALAQLVLQGCTVTIRPAAPRLEP